MAYLDYLTRDYERWICENDGSRDSDMVSAGALTAGAARQLQAVLVEVEQAQVLVAVSASIATALLEESAGRTTPRDMLCYMPATPLIYPSVVASILADAEIESILAVPVYFTRLEFAQRLTQNFCDLSSGETAAVRRVECEKLEDAWRRVCVAAIDAARTIRQLLADDGYRVAPAAHPHAEALLGAAQRGERPCIDDSGCVTVPGWAESRASKRHAVGIQVRIVYRGNEQSATLDNVSVSGFGLSGLEGGIPGRLISIAMPGIETLTGVIIWDRGGRTGVKLDSPLRDDHPLLKALP